MATSSTGPARGQVFSPSKDNWQSKREEKEKRTLRCVVCGQVSGVGRRRASCVSVSPGTEYNTHTRNLPGAHTRKTRVWVWECAGCVCARAASTWRFTKFLAHPERSLPPVDCAAGRGGGGRFGGREGGKRQGEGQRRNARVAAGGEAGGTHREAGSLSARREPSRRRGAAAGPSLVRLGRRPRQRSPGRRWAGGGCYAEPLQSGRSGRARRVDPSAAAPPPYPRGPGCAWPAAAEDLADPKPRARPPLPAA